MLAATLAAPASRQAPIQSSHIITQFVEGLLPAHWCRRFLRSGVERGSVGDQPQRRVPLLELRDVFATFVIPLPEPDPFNDRSRRFSRATLRIESLQFVKCCRLVLGPGQIDVAAPEWWVDKEKPPQFCIPCLPHSSWLLCHGRDVPSIPLSCL